MIIPMWLVWLGGISLGVQVLTVIFVVGIMCTTDEENEITFHLPYPL